MKFTRTFRAVLIGFVSLLTLSAPAVAGAADTGSSNGMKVSPVRTDLVLKPGESKTVTVYLQNVTTGNGDYKALFNDFQARGETGSPGLDLDNKTNSTHGLKKYVTFNPNLSIKGGETASVNVTVTIPKNAAGGGYYGAIRFVPASQATDKNVSLSGSVASLILVRVPGDITENVQVTSMDVRKNDSAGTFFTSGNGLKTVVRFRNLGNVQEEPFGKVLLKKGDKTLATYEVNNTSPRGNVLPDSIRRFDIDLKNANSLGKYTLQGNFGYGSNGQLLTASTSFYVVPLAVIVPGVVVLGLIIGGAVLAPKYMKRHDQRVLRRAGRR